jgi:2-keto-4-pentenoate hydratase
MIESKNSPWAIRVRGCLFLVAGAAFPVLLNAGDASSWGEIIIQCRKERSPFPLLSQERPEADIAFAYSVQRDAVARLVKGNGDTIVGYKAGLTSNPAQHRFGIKEPLAGVLLASMDRSRNAVIQVAEFQVLMIETEIAFVVGKRIRKPLKSKRSLRRRLRMAVAAIELPDLAFTDMEHLAAVDIAAANVAAAGFLKGSGGVRDGLDDLAGLRVTLEKGGVTVNEGTGSDTLGDPLEAALWLVNASVAQGYTIEPGHILLSGALGKMIPATPGEYRADYGDLGTIRFTIR